MGNKYGNVKVIRRDMRLGLGSAIVCGINYARGHVIAITDADLQHPWSFC